MRSRPTLRLAAVFLAALPLGACRTTADLERERSLRLESFEGLSMAFFIARTGLTPIDAYPIEGGKVFVIEGPTVVSTLPATQWTPAVSRASACRLLISTRVKELAPAAETAEAWIITGTSRTGPCQTLPI